MEEFRIISSSIRQAIDKSKYQELLGHANRFGDFLIDNLNNQFFSTLNGQILRDFELCCSVLEFELFHKNKETELCYVIKDISDQYPNLGFLKARMACLRYPDKINHISLEWKDSLQKSLIDILSMTKMSSNIFSLEGNKTYTTRVGIKVIAQINDQLKRNNISDELPIYLTKLITKLSDDSEEIYRVMSWLNQDNNHLFNKNLIII